MSRHTKDRTSLYLFSFHRPVSNFHTEKVWLLRNKFFSKTFVKVNRRFNSTFSMGYETKMESLHLSLFLGVRVGMLFLVRLVWYFIVEKNLSSELIPLSH